MKKFMFLFILMLALPALALAQDEPTVAPDILGGFVSLSALALLVTYLEEAIDKAWDLGGWASRIRTWFIGIGLAVAGHFLHIGLFAEASAPLWWPTFGGALGFAVVLGFLCALAANFGFKNWDAVRIILVAIGIRIPMVEDKAAIVELSKQPTEGKKNA